jgi:S1-C subfamily serine protease
LRRGRKLTIPKTALALLVIVVAAISSASTWIFFTYSTNQQGTSFGGLNPASIYASSSHGVVLVEGVQTTATPFGPDISTILGSGFVISQNGTDYLITNFHMVDRTTNLTVAFYDGNGYAAKVVADDPYSDLAVLSVPSAGLSEFHPLTLASSRSLTIGEPVLAIGNPYGLTASVTTGIISQIGRTIQETASGNFSIAGMIQFSAPINPGNSGGPLLNREGNVIGITTASVSSSQGVGFAIPSDTVSKELPYLIRTGAYNLHPYIGIEGADMNYQLSQLLRTNVTYGVLVENVIQGSPADAAGLKGGSKTATVQGQRYVLGGDIIVSINGGRILNNDDLATYLAENEVAGATVQLGIVRSGTIILISLLLGARPPPPAS